MKKESLKEIIWITVEKKLSIDLDYEFFIERREKEKLKIKFSKSKFYRDLIKEALQKRKNKKWNYFSESLKNFLYVCYNNVNIID